VLLGSTAATAIAPAGLLNDVSATTATAGGLAAFAGDVRALAAAIEATGPLIDPVLIMSSTSALLITVLSQSGAADMPIIAAAPIISQYAKPKDAIDLSFCPAYGSGTRGGGK
jgi:hypothetical protein